MVSARLTGTLKIAAMAAVALALGLATGCKPARSKTYSFALTVLPEKLNPWDNPVNVFNLLNNHLYWPLFERNPGNGKLESRYLDLNETRAQATEMREFSLCLRAGIRFSDGSPIRTDDLIADIQQFHALQFGMPKLASVHPTGDRCVSVVLEKPDAIYFDRLIGTASAILKKSSTRLAVPIGLGAFRMQSMSSQRVVLVANEGQSRFFDRIEFYLARTVDEALASHAIDLNHLHLGNLPAAARLNRAVITKQMLKAYALVINIADPGVRRDFARCFPATEFAELLPISLRPVDGFLPHGVLGSDVSFRETIDATRKAVGGLKCDWANVPKPTVPFYDYFQPAPGEDPKRFQKFFDRFAPILPVRIQVTHVEPERYVKLLYAYPAMVGLVGFDTSGSASGEIAEASAFFEGFTQGTGMLIVPKPLVEVEKMTRLGLQSSRAEDKQRYYRAAHRALLESGYVIPMGQLQATQYYPPWIHNIVWSDTLGGYPRVDLMEADAR